MADRATTPQSSKPTGGYKDRFWIPRFWDGMNMTAWWRLIVKNRFRVTPRRWGMAVIISSLSGMNSSLWAIQSLLYGRKIARTEIRDEPIFILGHWRSGTSLLHELLVKDPRHTFPSTYACFAPNHFLLTGGFFPPILNAIMPMQRPVDNMPVGWNHPQEDEFALCNMGVPSPYLSMAFANEPPQDPDYLTLDRLTDEERERWKKSFLWFLKCVSLYRPGRIVLKSPPHTARVRTLLEMFPKGRFVHIVRDPIVLFASTVNLWKRLNRDQGLQLPNHADLEERVFNMLNEMYEAFERDRAAVPPGQLCDIRYEELVADPVAQMRRVYEELDLGEFDKALPAIEAYVASQANYKKNRYDIPPETRAKIAQRWSGYIARYGYEACAREAG